MRNEDVEREKRRSQYGDLVSYYAAYRERDAAWHLAQKYQANGEPAFVYYDPDYRWTDIGVTEMTRGPEEILDLSELQIEGLALNIGPLGQTERADRPILMPIRGPRVDPFTGRAVKGAWRVEVGEPTSTEVELFGEGRVEQIPHGEKPRPDPKKAHVLYFPPATPAQMPSFFSGEGTSLLDAILYEAAFRPDADDTAECECATIPETGKQICTRKGARGILSEVQVATRCSTITEATNGRVRRAQSLREAQGICGELVKDVEDPAERNAIRYACLSDLLRDIGVTI